MNSAAYFTGLRSGNATAYPDISCLCPNDELDKTVCFHPLRTLKHMKAAMTMVQDLRRQGGQAALASDILKKLSMRDLEVRKGGERRIIKLN